MLLLTNHILHPDALSLSPFFSSFLRSSQKLQSFETGLTKKLSKMGAEHFVASPTKPDAYTKDEKTENTKIHKDRGIEP